MYISKINQPIHSTISGQHIFSQNGNVALTKGNHVWSTSDWSDEFKVEFDVVVNKVFSGSFATSLRWAMLIWMRRPTAKLYNGTIH